MVLHVGRGDDQGSYEAKRDNNRVPLAANHFFSGVVAAWPALIDRIDGLAVEYRHGRPGRTPRLLADPIAELRVQPLPSAVRLPPATCGASETRSDRAATFSNKVLAAIDATCSHCGSRGGMS